MRKASASPPTTDPAIKISPRPRRFSIDGSGKALMAHDGRCPEGDVRLCIMRRPPQGMKWRVHLSHARTAPRAWTEGCGGRAVKAGDGCTCCPGATSEPGA